MILGIGLVNPKVGQVVSTWHQLLTQTQSCQYYVNNACQICNRLTKKDSQSRHPAFCYISSHLISHATTFGRELQNFSSSHIGNIVKQISFFNVPLFFLCSVLFSHTPFLSFYCFPISFLQCTSRYGLSSISQVLHFLYNQFIFAHFIPIFFHSLLLFLHLSFHHHLFPLHYHFLTEAMCIPMSVEALRRITTMTTVSQSSALYVHKINVVQLDLFRKVNNFRTFLCCETDEQ